MEEEFIKNVFAVRKKLEVLKKYNGINPAEWDKAYTRLKADISKLKNQARSFSND